MKRADRLPYPGLRAYERDETDLFFGRDGCVNEMVEKLAATHFLAVLGASGAGKSSLVRTGLLDALELGFMEKAGSNWLIADFHPAGRPMHELAEHLLEARNGSKPDDEEIATLESFLRRGPGSVIEWIEDGNLPRGYNLLLLADQFEELFRYGSYADRESAEAFAALLLESARSSDRIYVVVTMRSEYLGACALIPGLAEQINASLYLTRRMTREECRQAIVGPARVTRFDIEPELTTRLLNDLATFAPWADDRERSQLLRLSRQADQLPLMQHALSRLWQKARTHGDGDRPLLTFDDYRNIGFLEGSLDQHGDEMIAALDEEAKAIVHRVFQALVTGPSVSDAVRRPLKFAKLVEIVGADREVVAKVVNAFRARGCNFLRPQSEREIDDESMIDISHESLIRQWQKLAAWFADEVVSAATWARLVDDEKLHRGGKGGLLTGLGFANPSTWFDRTKPTPGWAALHGGDLNAIKKFLDESREEDERAGREREERLEQERLHQQQLLRAQERENEQQQELLKSQEEKLEMRAREGARLQRRNMILVALAFFLVLAAGYTVYANLALSKAKTMADNAAEIANTAADEAKLAAEEAKKQAAIAEAEKQRADRLLEQAKVNLSRFLGYAARSLVEKDNDLALGLVLAALPVELDATPEKLAPDALSALYDVTADDRLRATMPFASLAAAFSLDGTRVVAAAASDGKNASIWNAKTGGRIATLTHDESVWAAAFSPDGSRVTTASYDETARIWDASTGVEIAKLTHDASVYTVAFSPDGTRVVTASSDDTARIWDAVTGREIARLTHESTVLEAEFSYDGGRVVTASLDNTARIWDAATASEVARLQHDDIVNTAEFSADGLYVVTASDDKTARIWDARNGNELAKLNHRSLVRAAEFSSDGSRIVTVANDNTARIWDVGTMKETFQLGHQDAVTAASFSPDGANVVTASSDDTARIWDTLTGREIARLSHEEDVRDAAFSADGKWIVTASSGGTRVWSARRGRMFDRLGHGGPVSVVAFSPDGTRLATASEDDTTRIWNTTTGLEVARLEDEEVRHIAFSPDGRRAVTASGYVRIWDTSTGKLIAEGSKDDLFYDANFSPDGDRVVAASLWDAAYIFDAKTGQAIGPDLSHEDTVRVAIFSPDGSRVVTASDDSTARIWDPATGREIARLTHDGGVNTAAFSPQGDRVVTAAVDNSARVWDVDTGSLVARMVHTGTVRTAEFSPDGRRIVTASDDATARIWDSTTGAEIATSVFDGAAYYATYSADGRRILVELHDSVVILDAETAVEIARFNHDSVVYDSGFSPDGNRVATASYDGNARIWEIVTTVDTLAVSRASETRLLTDEERAEYSVEPPAWQANLEKRRREVLTDCDREAGHPYDSQLGPGGKDFNLIDPVKAVEVCQKAVEANPDEPRFRYQLGRALNKAEKAEDAIRQFEAAADMGYPMAMYNLGFAYAEGDGVSEDDSRAAELYAKAVDAGEPAAAGNLGSAYWDGEGVERSEEKAIDLWKRAAGAGNPWSHSQLAERAEEAATDQGLIDALYHLTAAIRFSEVHDDLTRAKDLRYRRASLARNLPPEVVAEQWRRAMAFVPTPLVAGNP